MKIKLMIYAFIGLSLMLMFLLLLWSALVKKAVVTIDPVYFGFETPLNPSASGFEPYEVETRLVFPGVNPPKKPKEGK